MHGYYHMVITAMYRKIPETNTLALTEKNPIDFLVCFHAYFIPLHTG